MGCPGAMMGVRASKIVLQTSKDLFEVGVRRYLPAARIAFSET
jgi:hypothetical protein